MSKLSKRITSAIWVVSVITLAYFGTWECWIAVMLMNYCDALFYANGTKPYADRINLLKK